MHRLYILFMTMVVMVGALCARHQALAEVLTGTEGDDTLVGTDRDDRFTGFRGSDRFTARDGEATNAPRTPLCRSLRCHRTPGRCPISPLHPPLQTPLLVCSPCGPDYASSL